MATQSLMFEAAAERPDFQFGSDLLRVFWRRKLIVILTVAVVTLAAAAYAYLKTPTYRSTGSLIVATTSQTRQGNDVPMSATQDDTLIANQTEVMASRAVARHVAESLALVDDLEFNPAAKPGAPAVGTALEDTTDALQDHVQVSRVGRSAIITVTASSTSAEKAAKIANKFLADHISLQAVEKASSNRSTALMLRPQVELLRQQVIDADRKVAEYRRAHNIVGPVDAPDLSQIGRLAGTLSDARSSRTEAAARAGAAAPASLGSTGSSATSPLLNDLRRQSAELGKRVAELSAYYGPGYPELSNARAQLDDINRRVAEEQARVGRELRTEVSIGRAREGQISGDLSRLTGQSFAVRSAAVRLLDLEREAEARRSIYVDLLSRLRQVEGQSKLVQVPAKVFARAVPATEPDSPKRKEIVSVAALGSFVLGLILAFAAEQQMDRKIRTGAQAERLLGAPMLGMVPSLPGLSGAALYRTLASSPGSAFSESVRNVYLELCQHMPGFGPRVVLVTSPLPGEGKTTLALCLGAAAAVLGRKAVVVDFDLRRPGMLEIMGEPARDADLVTFLRRGAALDDIVIGDPVIPNLSMVAVNARPEDPAALLSHAQLGELMRLLRGRFDFIVLNAPPLLAVRDAKTLSSFANATMLVLRWCKTHNDAVLSAARYFGRPFTGAVINQVDYAVHARSAHGDAVQHYHACSSYYFGAAPAKQAAKA